MAFAWFGLTRTAGFLGTDLLDAVDPVVCALALLLPLAIVFAVDDELVVPPAPRFQTLFTSDLAEERKAKREGVAFCCFPIRAN